MTDAGNSTGSRLVRATFSIPVGEGALQASAQLPAGNTTLTECTGRRQPRGSSGATAAGFGSSLAVLQFRSQAAARAAGKCLGARAWSTHARKS